MFELGAKATGPLRGLRVVDVSTVVSGPLCAQILGDLGADVVKLEAPRGENARRMGMPIRAGMSPLFAQCNRNKRSVVVDFKRPEGVAVAKRLARDADVWLENFRPGVSDRLGLGYEALSRANPGLVFVSITGFGPDGPYRDLPAYDTVVQGLTGFLPMQGDGGPPTLVQSIVADKATALTAAYAAMGALFERLRAGEGARGQRVDVPMLDAYASFILADTLGLETFPGHGLPALPSIHRTWQTADGWVVIMTIEDAQFQGLCRALGREDVAADERFASLMQRLVHMREMFELLEEELRKHDTETLLRRAREEGAPIAPANDLEGFFADPQVRHNRTVFEHEDDPELQRTRFLRSPVRFAASPANLRRLPPRQGEHSDEVLREAGYSDEEIAALREDGAIG